MNICFCTNKKGTFLLAMLHKAALYKESPIWEEVDRQYS